MTRRAQTPALPRIVRTSLFLLGSGTLPCAGNLSINPTFVDSAGETWDATRIAVVEQAISEWSSLLGAALPTETYEVDITFDFTNAGTSSYLGQWQASSSGLFPGDDRLPWLNTSHVIHFNASYFDTNLPNYSWWDSTPLDGSDQPFAAWDMLTVARHELGHALGYTTFYVYDIATASENYPWESLITDVGGNPIFDAGGLDIEMASWTNLGHVAPMNDLMDASLFNGTRRDISQTNINMLTMAYGYSAIPEPSVVFLVAGSGLLLLRRRR